MLKMEETLHNLVDKMTCSLSVSQLSSLGIPVLPQWIHKLNGLHGMNFPLSWLTCLLLLLMPNLLATVTNP